MKTIGVICEYNPLHLGHANHLIRSRKAMGENSAIICVMSGNVVQRGDFAIFNKHSRAKAAVLSGADLVVELPAPYVLSSAEGFAKAGVFILEKMGVCDYISFGSEVGNVEELSKAVEFISSDTAQMKIKSFIKSGLAYATAIQHAADELFPQGSELFNTPNNILGIEYIKALNLLKSKIKPLTVYRSGGAHDSVNGFSASRLRRLFRSDKPPWILMPRTAAAVLKEEVTEGRGPLYISDFEAALLSRLRKLEDFSAVSNASEGIERRFLRYSGVEPTIEEILKKIKTKRYPMSRIRRMLLCAALDITADDSAALPPYIRILAMNQVGAAILKKTKKISELPIITKPAAGKNLPGRAGQLLHKEASVSDFYALGYNNVSARRGRSEWTTGPYVQK